MSKTFCILVADDDPDDRMMIAEAFAEAPEKNQTPVPLYFVENGEQLIEYLKGDGMYSNRESFPYPSLILLDLNMPRKDGREALREIKANPDLRKIPVIVLTTSKAEEDIMKSYDLGVNSFVTKPLSYHALVDVTRTFSRYWFEISELPPNRKK